MTINPTYVSPRGLETLRTLRVDRSSVPAVQGYPQVVLLASVPSEECGCPEEIWLIDGVEILIHFEADGSSEMFIYTGDEELEFMFDNCKNIHELRSEMFQAFGDMVQI